MPVDELTSLILQKKYDQWAFVQLLKQLFPRGPLWRFQIIKEP